MDSDKKRQLKKAYQQQELLKMAENDDEIIAALAKEQLIGKFPILTIEAIKAQEDAKFIDFLWLSIRELIAYKKRFEWKRYQTELEITDSLTAGQKMIYFTQEFENLNAMGDFDKFYQNTPKWEINESIKSYDLIGCKELAEAIRQANESTAQVSYNEPELLTKKLKYIKANINQFEIKQS